MSSADVAEKQWNNSFVVPSGDDKGTEVKLNSESWPLLLRDYARLNVRSQNFTPIAAGATPLRRSLEEHLKYGIIVLDKPANPSSHEVVSWIKRIFDKYIPMKGIDEKGHKTGHCGTLDPKVTGTLIICLNRATRLAKSQQNAGKQYVGIVRFHHPLSDSSLLKDCIEREFLGPLFQKPPPTAAVKRVLRIRTVSAANLIEYDPTENMAIFRVDCESGTYVRTLCQHYGLFLGVGGHMQELRRTRSGAIGELDGLSTLHDVLDASFEYGRDSTQDYLRRVVLPLETLLRGHKRIVVKDSCVSALCYGAKCMLPGVLRFEDGIVDGDAVVLMTTKGEAVAMGTASMSSTEMASASHGIAAKLKRVIMDKELYPRRWGLGPIARARALLIAESKLGKHGKVNESTPEAWWKAYVDYRGNPTNESAQQAHKLLCRNKNASPSDDYDKLAKFAPSLAASAIAGDSSSAKKKQKGEDGAAKSASKPEKTKESSSSKSKEKEGKESKSKEDSKSKSKEKESKSKSEKEKSSSKDREKASSKDRTEEKSKSKSKEKK